ncbi:MAG: SH3 domain-containing protein [Chloroflexota bacterium]|nr:SH3 domain-containing protein [Chloroflexota bacterium]
MNARRFDALAVSMTGSVSRSSRRKLLRGLAGLAAASLAPARALAFDGGAEPFVVAPGAQACASGADCAAGEICLNGACSPRSAVGGSDNTSTSGTGSTSVNTTGTATEPVVPPTTSVNPPETSSDTGVGGLIQPGEPLPARIFAGRCGALSAEPAFQLIDVGSVEGVENNESPVGALTAIPAEFSTTVVNATLDTLLASEHAIDIRVDANDPATSIACGDIGGPVEAGATGDELAVGLQERGQSAYSGIAWLQSESDRTLVRVFMARGLDEGAAVSVAQEAQTAPDTSAAPAETPAAEAAQAAATPTVGAIAPIGAGSTVVTTIDVNLRAEPSDDATVLTILGEGVELDVTGSPADGWIPVIDPASGQAGFVSDQFIAIAS